MTAVPHPSTVLPGSCAVPSRFHRIRRLIARVVSAVGAAHSAGVPF